MGGFGNVGQNTMKSWRFGNVGLAGLDIWGRTMKSDRFGNLKQETMFPQYCRNHWLVRPICAG